MPIDPNKIYYSLDNGQTWEGPFSAEEIDALTHAGIIPANALIVREGEQLQATQEPQQAAQTQDEPPPLQAAPAHDSVTYMLGINGQQYGPYSKQQIMQMKAARQVPANAQYWTQGMSSWHPIAELINQMAPSLTGTGAALPKLQGFSIGKFFSDVFTHHSKEEIDAQLCCGSASTTPPLGSINTSWPSPWIFARFLGLFLLLYFGFDWMIDEFKNPKTIPGFLFVGVVGIPCSVFLLLFELNVRKDVPLYKGFNAILIGGLVSLILALFFFRHSAEMSKSLEASWAGPVEELAKLLTVILIAKGLRNGRILTGILLGGAVGTGFAIFETGGYVYETIIMNIHDITGLVITNVADVVIQYQGAVPQTVETNLVYSIYNTIYDAFFEAGETTLKIRALLSPFCHVIWTAITAGAFWMVQGLKIKEGSRHPADNSFGLGTLLDFRFLKIAVIPVILHMFWNSELLTKSETQFFVSRIVLGLIGWFIVLRLVQKGLHQIREEQEQQANQQK